MKWLEFLKLHTANRSLKKEAKKAKEKLSKEEFAWRWQWQLDLAQRKLDRATENFDVWHELKKQRWLWLVLAGLISAVVALRLMTGEFFAWPSEAQFAELMSKNGSGTLITALISAPVAFALWWFRDTNALWQIENQRKETNLKDFQKLAEWASGLHLVEDKETTSNKTTQEPTTEKNSGEKDGVLPDSKNPSNKTETTTTRERSRLPDNITLETTTRREGSVSLQIAAVYQLQAFLRGDYGAHFKEPAFALLKSIWLSLMQNHVKAWDYGWFAPGKEINQKAFDAWQNAIRTTCDTPLAQAITTALASNYGQYLRDHKEQLPGMCLAGLNTRLAGLKPLELDGLDLRDINLQGSNLWQAQLQGASLPWAQLQGANFVRAQLQDANLQWARLQGAYLHDAQLQGANLQRTQLQGADLWQAQLQNTNLSDAQLQGAKLEEAKLQGAILLEAKLQGAYLPRVRLQGANLEDAQLQGADLRGADIQGANFTDADLTGAKFYKSQLKDLQLNPSITPEQLASIVVEDDPFRKSP